MAFDVMFHYGSMLDLLGGSVRRKTFLRLLKRPETIQKSYSRLPEPTIELLVSQSCRKCFERDKVALNGKD